MARSNFIRVPFEVERREIIEPPGLFREAELEEVPVSKHKIIATQAHVSKQGLQKYLTGEVDFSYGEGLGLPQVIYVRDEDRYYILDGHHRFTAALMKKRPTVRAEVAELSGIIFR